MDKPHDSAAGAGSHRVNCTRCTTTCLKVAKKMSEVTGIGETETERQTERENNRVERYAQAV